MSAHMQLVIGVWFTGICVVGTTGLLGWLLWSMVWDSYDYLMQQRRRARNNRFDGARVTPKQFHIPPCFRDQKGLTK
jgi:hypothetical protein